MKNRYYVTRCSCPEPKPGRWVVKDYHGLTGLRYSCELCHHFDTKAAALKYLDEVREAEELEDMLARMA